MFQNKLLSSLPENVRDVLLPRLRPVSLMRDETLFLPQMPIDSVWFIESGCVSLVATLVNGRQAEIGVVGYEGMVGPSLGGRATTSDTQAIVQSSGTALRMERGAFHGALNQEEALRSVMFSYERSVQTEIIERVACTGHHGTEQRLARWLLNAQDRLRTDDVFVTHDYLAHMLCVYRPTATIITQALEAAGAISCTRGKITIVDRACLERMACECYQTARRRFDHDLAALI